MTMTLSGQTAMVTGGTRGIGAAVSEALLAAGVRVRAIYARNDEAALAWSAAFPPERLSIHKVDIADHAAVEQLFASLGRELHILINCAAIRDDSLLGLMSETAWRSVIDVDLTGAFNVCKFAVRAMVGARYGRIVNITSPSARLPLPGQSNYGAAKAGVIAMTRTLAAEVARRGITANCVCPGLVKTDLIGDLTEAQMANLLSVVPMKRMGTPEEIAAAVMFLVSPAASYVTGAVLDVTGGS